MDQPYPGRWLHVQIEAGRRTQLARSIQPLPAVCLREIVWQLGRPQASPTSSWGPRGIGRRGRRDTIGLHRGRGVSDFWPDFFSAGWTCWIKWAGKDVCGYKRVGGPVPGFLGSATTTSTDPVKCECVATAHCVHPSTPLSPTVAGSLLLLTFLPLNRPHVCLCRHMILAAYPGCRAAAGDGGGFLMMRERESCEQTSMKVSCPGDDHGGWSRGRQPFLV